MGALLRLVRSVLWSLLGVRRGADSARDLEGARPGTLIIVAVAIVAVIVLGLSTLARLIGSDQAAPGQAVRETHDAAPIPNAPASATAVQTARSEVPDTIAERMRACVGCHGDETRPTTGGYSPRIAGKPAGYLFNQLTGFRDGRRAYAPMVYLVQHMSDEYLREVADYFAGLEIPYPPPERVQAAPDVLARGRNLVANGDAVRNIPACSDCHGSSLSGVAPAIPGLLGLPRDYLNAQLGAWRTGTMRAIQPDCMGEVARRLASDDVTAISAWLASQPVPEGFRPAAGLAHPLPLECGSITVATP